METAIHGLPNIIVYIADLLQHLTTHEEHLKHLEALLTQLRQHGIKIDLPKREFGS